MSNPVRLGRYAFGADSATEGDRMDRHRRRYDTKDRPLLLPAIFVALLLYLVIMPSFAQEVTAGKTRSGMAFVITKFSDGPLLEFRMYLTTERR